MPMRKARFYIFVVGAVLFHPAQCFALTRNNVLDSAAAYAGMGWVVGENNILDVYNHVNSTSPVPMPGSDGRDDRAYTWDVKNSTWVYSTRNWPFEVCSTCTYHGEAYAWGGWNDVAKWGADTTSTFTTRRLSSLKWIAGGRAGVDIPYSGKTTMPLGYRGYTGIDCSGFVGNVLEISRFASDGYKLNTSTLTNYAVSVTVAELKPGDMLNNPGAHVALFAGWINKPFTARIIHASYKNFSKNQYEYHVTEDSATITGSGVSKTLFARTADGYYPFSFFPQFRWSAPAADYAPLDPVDNAIALRIDSARALTKVDITLDPGTAGAARGSMLNDGLYLSTVPAAEGKGFEVRWQLPASFILTEGMHTLVAYARNDLGLEDRATTYFYVGADDIPPVIAWEDAVNLVPANGYVTGLRPLEEGPWFHGDLLKLTLSDYQSPLSSFTIYSPLGEEVYHKEFLPGTKSVGISEAIEYLPDAAGYRAVLTDRPGNTTELYFHIDRSTPMVTIDSIVSRLNSDKTGHIFDISGLARDLSGTAGGGASGLGGPVLNLAGAGAVVAAYTGPAWPPGPAEELFSFTGSTDSRKFLAFDRAGWRGITELGITPGEILVNLEYPGEAEIYQQSGLILKRVELRAYKQAGIRFLNAPEGLGVKAYVETRP